MPERFDLASEVPADERVDALRAIAPDAFREGKLDFDALRRSLADWVDPGPERFGLTWPGKAECMRVIQEPSIGTLMPMRNESADWDTTQNVIIEGDNLEVLKLMQKAYYGKVKLIYIDPPYNTGKEFIYPDNFREGLADYLRYSGQADESGFKLTANTETDGRYHSKWLSMMYPRLFLARNLLREDGVIFITVDDAEEANLRLLCDEIFGPENFQANIAWQKKYSVSNNQLGIASVRDFVLVYSRASSFERGLLPRDADSLARYQNPDSDPRGPWKPVDYWNMASPEQRPNLVYDITNPNTGETVTPSKKAWKFSREVHESHAAENRIWWGGSGRNSVPALKLFLSDVRDGLIPDNWWPHEEVGHTDEAKKQLDRLFEGEAPFDTPKPVRLIQRMFQVGNLGTDDLVLDFFAGSGATGQAVVECNAADGGSRRYVMVQLPEPTTNQAFPTIATITRERMRRVATAPPHEQASLDSFEIDRGFRSFRLSASNFEVWDSSVTADDLEEQLEFSVEYVRDGSTQTSMLTELLLKAGYSLSSHVESVDFAGVAGHSVAEGALIVCLTKGLSVEAFEAMVEYDPVMILVLDSGFGGSDELKVNALQTVRARNQSTGGDITLRVV
jgi:adenine-specific DNA-methyltransferase